MNQTQNQFRPDSPQKGDLKIFFGYAAGVGKTYAMLEAAHQAQKRGADVVVGYIERHTRPDTLALLEGLEQLPEKIVEYKGITLKELDLDAALQRRPNILLVDELAHSNAAGCRHAKRYQDVEELLRAGISVYTTVNVQHLESLNDLVASITHISVSERIPDSVFDSADQVELVDIEPDDLILRLQSGKVYQKQQASRALDHFFTKDNLAALREIALRRTADQLSKKAQKAENETAAKAGEHILTCLSSAPSNAKVIRTAARMAEAFHSGFTALFVETADTKELRGENLKRLRDNMRLAEQLGARIATVYGEDPAVQIAEYAKVSGVTKIVLGRTNHHASPLMKSKTLVDRLTSRMEDVDVYIIPDVQPLYKKKRALFHKPEQGFNWKDFGKSILLIIAATGTGFLFYELGLREANIIIVYLLGVLLTAVWTNGYFYGILVSLLSVVSFNFFFTIPRFSLTALDPNYPVTFLVMLLASCLSCSLATRVKRQARQSAQRAYYMELLMSSNQKMQQGQNEQEIIQIAASQLQSLLDRPILYALLEKDRQIRFRVVPASETEQVMGRITPEELGVADWVAKNDKHAGATTNTLSDAQNLYLSVRGNQEVMAVVGIPAKFYLPLDAFEKNLMIAILDECGLILERRKLRAEKQTAELETQREQLRANLLRAISHDLRTPLTGISGNAGMLMEKSFSLDESKKQEMYRSIYDDSMWLVNLTENLLSITRIENGTMPLRRNAELIDDIFHEALSHVDRRAMEHEIHVELADDMLMANMDARLIIQVIINIVNNAIKYTPEGSQICLSAKREKRMVRIEIADNGSGISDAVKRRLFDMFYTANAGGAGADSRRGLGLGLSLCKSIVEAHGGSITVRDNQPHGAVFSFTLPLEEVKIQNV
ncbi:MAG TPA: sensor histidine kinase KdpD [Candidatus Excrementavichristensenella intestinipullorum]|nr:sensor histidine kinase KdpD [Candidatus Excrementavichristensenella intestinipullorum]